MTPALGGGMAFFWGWIPSAVWGGTSVTKEVTATVGTGAPDGDIVDDFNDGNNRNYWDGVMGVTEETASAGSINHSYVTAGAYGGKSLALTYDLTKASNWNGFYLMLNNEFSITKNISAYKHLSFWVKGAVGGKEHLKIGLENTSANSTNRNRAAIYVNDYLDGGITTGWKKVSIPLGAFSGLNSLATAKALSFVFEKDYVDPARHPALAKTGTVYIDDVRFSTTELPVLRIDPFGDNWGLNALGGNWGNMKMDGHVDPTMGFSSSIAGAVAWTLVSNYDVQTAGSWQGHYCLFGGGVSGWDVYPVSVSHYRYFKFSLKAKSATENPESIKIELKSGNLIAPLVITGITPTFQTMSIDLNAAALQPFVDKTAFMQINIVYENTRIGAAGGDKKGTLYFDHFEFSTTP